MMPSSDSVEIHNYPYGLINSRWCRLLCASGNYIFIYSCTLLSSILIIYLLFIEQDVDTHLYITESHSMYGFSCLFIMIMIEHKTKCIKCHKGHNFVICCFPIVPMEFFYEQHDPK